MTRAKSAAAKSAAPAPAAHLVKIGPTGAELAADATEWDAVLDRRTGRMWLVKAAEVRNWKPATIEKIEREFAQLRAGGFSDWRIPTVEEAFTLVDRTRTSSPAIDVEFFPDCPSDWFWTSTPYAPSPGVCAWVVGFGSGYADYYSRDNHGFVRAVRASQ